MPQKVRLPMFLSKDTNGIYYVYYPGSDGKTKRNSTRCRFKTDALKFLQTFKVEQSKKSKTIFFSSFATEFIQHTDTDYSKRTKRIYEDVFKLFVRIIGDIPLSYITPKYWDKYKSERMKPNTEGKTLSPITINIELRTLRASFNTALRWNYIKNNPFSRQKLCFVNEQSPVFFTRENFQQLINCIGESWLKEIVIFATLTGMRRGEIINLKWSDIDLQRKTLAIQSNPTFRTKQGKRRTIPLNDTAVYILQQKANKGFSDYVFTFKRLKINYDTLTHKFKDMVVLSKLDNQKLHFHSLRHTFASWLVQDGVSLYEVQKLLGHSNIAVTQVYSHLQPEQLHNTVNKIHISMN